MKYSPRYFAQNMPKKKFDGIPFVCKIFFRPLGYVFSTLFAYLRFSANAVSVLNFLVAIASCTLLFFDKTCAIISAGLFCFWVLLDNVDGNLARCIKKQKYGDFFDAVSGYFFAGFYLICLGYYCYNHGGYIFDAQSILPLLCGAIGSVSQISLFLYNKKFQENTRLIEDNVATVEKEKPLYFKIGWAIINELSFGGLMPIVAVFAVVFEFHDIFLIAYSSLYALLFVAGVSVLFLKGILANHKRND